MNKKESVYKFKEFQNDLRSAITFVLNIFNFLKTLVDVCAKIKVFLVFFFQNLEYKIKNFKKVLISFYKKFNLLV